MATSFADLYRQAISYFSSLFSTKRVKNYYLRVEELENLIGQYKEFPLAEGKLSIERSPNDHVVEASKSLDELIALYDNRIVLDDEYVSRDHGEILREKNSVRYMDNSLNGSILVHRRGRRQFMRWQQEPMYPGDSILIGGKQKGTHYKITLYEHGKWKK